jgi:hypothetical protein
MDLVLSLIWIGNIVWYKTDKTKMNNIIIEHKVRLLYSPVIIVKHPK